MGEMTNAYRILVVKTKGKRPCGRPRLRWDNTIRMDLSETWLEVGVWIHLAQDGGAFL
jgi:hypothetical protein